MIKKVEHNTDNQYLEEKLQPSKLFFMHNLSANFLMFLDIAKSVFKSSINEDGNFRFYPRKPKLSGCQIIALSLTAESIGIDLKTTFLGSLRAIINQIFLIYFTVQTLTEERKPYLLLLWVSTNFFQAG